jgi:stearoyl-CoA desaturase (Delta-9 desaturase)
MHEPVVVDPTRKPRYTFSALSGFIIVHLAALGVFALGFSWLGVFLCIGSYYLRMFALTAGYHRYFSHRSFQLNRFWQFLLALLGQTAAQKGALWWAAHHRHHHRFSDQPEDLHSPLQGGFIWSHMGWILVDDYRETEYDQIKDMTKFPELVWLNKNPYLPTIAYAVAMFFAFGPVGLFYGYFLSTVLLWHGTFSINSIMHVFGRRVYRTTDDSRNSMIFALVTMGEGWHNNHHYYPGSAAQGFRWWQIDMSYYILLLGEKLGIVKNLRRVPERVVAEGYDKVSAAETDSVRGRIERLSQQWDEVCASANVLRSQAVAELESARVKTAERLNQLEADYRRARRRAGLLAEAKVDQLRADIERLYQQLREILERLLEAVASDSAAQPA